MRRPWQLGGSIDFSILAFVNHLVMGDNDDSSLLDGCLSVVIILVILAVLYVKFLSRI